MDSLDNKKRNYRVYVQIDLLVEAATKKEVETMFPTLNFKLETVSNEAKIVKAGIRERPICLDD